MVVSWIMTMRTSFPLQILKALLDYYRLRGLWRQKTMLSILIFSALAQITPPGESFELASLEAFFPGQSMQAVVEKYGSGEVYSEKIRLFYLTHKRYKFPVFVHSKEGVVVAFWARLPSYFLHDPFHAALIERYGPQERYRRQNHSAVYSWNLRDKNIRLIYSGQCTLSCFPVYLAGVGGGLDGIREAFLNRI